MQTLKVPEAQDARHPLPDRLDHDYTAAHVRGLDQDQNLLPDDSQRHHFDQTPEEAHRHDLASFQPGHQGQTAPTHIDRSEMAAAYDTTHRRAAQAGHFNSTPPNQFPAGVTGSGTPSFAGGPDSTANTRQFGAWRVPFSSNAEKSLKRESQLMPSRNSTVAKTSTGRGAFSSSSRRMHRNSVSKRSNVTPFSPHFNEELSSSEPRSSSSRNVHGSRQKSAIQFQHPPRKLFGKPSVLMPRAIYQVPTQPKLGTDEHNQLMLEHQMSSAATRFEQYESFMKSQQMKIKELNQAKDLTPTQLELLALHRRTSHNQQDAENRNCLNMKRRKLFEEQEEDECIASEGENNDRYKYSSAKKWRKKAADFESVAPLQLDQGEELLEEKQSSLDDGFKVPRDLARPNLSALIDDLLSHNNDPSAVNEESEFAFTQGKCPASATSRKDDARYNRKEKSLGELCKRFLCLYGSQERELLFLDRCTTELRTERRRIYDIINILESFCVIRRQAKNSYQWRGIDRIVKSIEAQIQQSEEFLQKNMTTLNLKRSLTEVAVDSQALDEGPVHMPNFIEIKSDEEEQAIFREIAKKNGSRIKKYKKEKSLGILCQQFIHLFVTWADVISLEGAAYRISLSEREEDRKNKKSTANQREQKLKTKIRRLYDIANVLTSLGLIKKCRSESKKPAFQWVGLDGTKSAISEIKELHTLLNEKYKAYILAARKEPLPANSQDLEGSQKSESESPVTPQLEKQQTISTPEAPANPLVEDPTPQLDLNRNAKLQERRERKMMQPQKLISGLRPISEIDPTQMFKQVHAEHLKNLAELQRRMAHRPSELAFIMQTQRMMHMQQLMLLAGQVRVFEAKKHMLSQCLSQLSASQHS